MDYLFASTWEKSSTGTLQAYSLDMTKTTKRTVKVGKTAPRAYKLYSHTKGIYRLENSSLMLVFHKGMWSATGTEGQGFGSTLQMCMSRVDNCVALVFRYAFEKLVK